MKLPLSLASSHSDGLGALQSSGQGGTPRAFLKLLRVLFRFRHHDNNLKGRPDRGLFVTKSGLGREFALFKLVDRRLNPPQLLAKLGLYEHDRPTFGS